MKVTATKEELIVPKKLLRGIKQANVVWEKNKIIIMPTEIESDPTFSLGTHPGHSGLKGAFITINTCMRNNRRLLVSGLLMHYCP